MKLIINTSHLSGTGVVQVAISFISECKNFSEHEYHVFMSKTIYSQLDIDIFPPNFKFYKILHHPFYGWKGFKTRKYLKKLEKHITPDVVFSVFGPSYWKPQAKHLLGYAYPHYVYEESPLFQLLNFRDLLKIKIMKMIHCYSLKRDGSYYVCETTDVSSRLSKLLSVDPNQVFTVENTCNHYFWNYEQKKPKLLPQNKNCEFRFLALCSPYTHKNLSIINSIVPLLRKRYPELNVKFVLSIGKQSVDKLFRDDVKDYIIDIGTVNVADCPQVYAECHALFLPTLLECFSANYPEAMCMGKPILTSNLSFATVVCEDAALYFDPLDANFIVHQIKSIVEDNMLYESLVIKGKNRLRLLNTPNERAEKYLSICSSLL